MFRIVTALSLVLAATAFVAPAEAAQHPAAHQKKHGALHGTGRHHQALKGNKAKHHRSAHSTHHRTHHSRAHGSAHHSEHSGHSAERQG